MALGLADHGGLRLRLRGHAARVGIDSSHLQPPRREPPADAIAGLTPVRSMLSVAAEPFAIAWFAMRGVPVAVPSQPCAYDLLVTLPAGAQRVQVKTTTWKASHGTWVVGVGRRPYVMDKSAARVPYDPDDLDYFFIIDGDGRIYFIPSDVVAGRIVISVGAYQEYLVGHASGLIGTRADSRGTSVTGPNI